MILSDGKLKRLIEQGYLSIENFEEENFTPNGYDVTVAEVSVEGRKPEKEGVAVIPVSTWFAVSTDEYFKFPPDIAGQIWIRTTWARRGIIPSFGMIDAGFEGDLTLSAFNTHKEVELPIGDTFAQVVFHLMDEDAKKTYDVRSGNYQGQRGINLGKE